MPHLTVEYSANLTALAPRALLLRLNQALVDAGHAKELDIKGRAIAFEDFQIGTEPGNRAFVHVKLLLLSGRTPEVKREIADRLLQVLQQQTDWPQGMLVQCAVELRDIDRAAFASGRIGA